MAISVTNYCPLTCKHCISRSGPSSVAAGEAFLADLETFFAVNPFNTKQVSLTGGEPLYDFDVAVRLIGMLAACGIEVSVITSAYWAKNLGQARDLCERLSELTTMTISYDVYHADFVKLAFVRNAYQAAKEAHIAARIRIVQSFPPEPGDCNLTEQVLTFALAADVEFQRLIKYGRADDEQIATAGYSPSVKNFCPSTGPHITETGKLTPCCNSIMGLKKPHALEFGDIGKDKPSALSASVVRNRLMLVLKTRGRAFLADELRSEIGSKVDEMAICDLCYEVCSNTKLQQALLSKLSSLDEQVTMYSTAFHHFGFDEFKPLLIEALSDELRARM